MHISELPLPEKFISYFREKGIEELYPPQEEAIKAGALDGRNLLVSIPTASGKTFIAEVAMIRAFLEGKKSIYIVPLKALANEKYEEFSRLRPLGISVAISTGDYDKRDEHLGNYDIVVMTSEKADSLLRNDAQWMKEIGLVVVDEVHLIDSPERGPTLEVMITRLRRLIPGIQIVALSATVSNSAELADWLNASLVRSNWRPVELKEGVFYRGKIHFERETVEVKGSGDPVSALVLDTISNGGQCLVFENTRRNAESRAKKIASECNLSGSRRIAEELLSISETEMSRKLAWCVERGAAFHHAGLSPEQRRIVEKGFRDGEIHVIVCTPTLSAGINMPARRVIIRSYRRYDVNYGNIPISVIEYKQMAGRAGRPHLDPFGEAVLMASSEEEMDRLFEHYIFGEPERIFSKLSSEKALRCHILSLIASGDVRSEEEALEFISETFYPYSAPPYTLERRVSSVLHFLRTSEMIDGNEELSATPLGKLVSRLYLDPLSAKMILDDLNRDDFTELTILHSICRTPDMRVLYLGKRDYDWVVPLAESRKEELVFSTAKDDYEYLLSALKTAYLLYEWIEEVPEEKLEAKYGVGPGDIFSLRETAEWLVHATAELLRFRGISSELARKLELRLKHGVKEELLPLTSIRNIGRVRARKLFNSGIRNFEDFVKRRDVAEALLGKGVVEMILRSQQR
ncbi:MAG: ATP-dependent helicase [Archaeoglobi archaeon]|nr:ATP-dependent helicase [Archaeoglobi archaeon]